MTVNQSVRIDEAFAQGTPIDEAMNQAAREAVERHRQAGLPVVVWRNGRVTEVDAAALLERKVDCGDEDARS